MNKVQHYLDNLGERERHILSLLTTTEKEYITRSCPITTLADIISEDSLASINITPGMLTMREMSCADMYRISMAVMMGMDADYDDSLIEVLLKADSFLLSAHPEDTLPAIVNPEKIGNNEYRYKYDDGRSCCVYTGPLPVSEEKYSLTQGKMIEDTEGEYVYLTTVLDTYGRAIELFAKL